MKIVKLSRDEFFKEWDTEYRKTRMFCFVCEDTFLCSKCCFKVICGKVLKQI